jgi:hypothetical protein
MMYRLSKRAANSAHADYGGGLDAFYGSHEVLGRCALVRIGLPEINKVVDSSRPLMSKM